MYLNQLCFSLFLRFYTVKLAALLVFALSLQTTAAADDEEQIRILLAMNLTELLDVEVTVASKSEQTVGEAPSSVTVFTRREIQNMGVTTLGELLDFVPGFQSFRLALNGDAQGFQVRGNPMLPVFTRDVLVLMDGRRLNGSHSGGAVLYNPSLNLDNVKQVEVIRGPGSALYGSNAFLGVINLITADKLNAATARVGSHASKEAILHLSAAGAPWQAAAFVRAYGDQGESYRGLSDRFGRHGAARDRQRGADADLKLSRGDFTLRLRHTHRWSQDFLDSEYLGDNGINRAENEQNALAFTYQHAFSDTLNLRLSGGYTRSQLYFVSHTGKQIVIWPAYFCLYLENDALNVDVDADWQPDSRNRWQAGFTYENTGNTDNALIDTGPDGGLRYLRGADSFTENRDRDIFGLYLQHQRGLRDDLALVAGVRYDRYSDFGDTINPRGALIYTTPWQDQLKLLYGQAFRAPNLADLTLNVVNSRGNPDLDPEKVESVELAYVHRADYGQAIATLFRNHISDVIAIEPDATGQFFAGNEGELERHGLELEVSLEPLPDWMLRATYTYLFEGAERHAPGRFGSLMLNRHWQRWNFNLNATYQSPISTLAQPQTTWVANAAVRYQLTADITVQAVVRNLSDETYYDPPEFTALSDDELRGMEPGIPNRGRWWWLGMEIRL